MKIDISVLLALERRSKTVVVGSYVFRKGPGPGPAASSSPALIGPTTGPGWAGLFLGWAWRACGPEPRPSTSLEGSLSCGLFNDSFKFFKLSIPNCAHSLRSKLLVKATVQLPSRAWVRRTPPTAGRIPTGIFIVMPKFPEKEIFYVCREIISLDPMEDGICSIVTRYQW